MKKIAALTLSLFLTYGTALADTPKDADAQPAKPAAPAKAKAAKKADKSESAIAAEIEELRQTLQAQQEQLSLLKEELAKRDRQIDEARDAAAAANARAAEASTKATEAVNTTAAVKSTADTLNTTVADLKTSNEVLKTTVATEQADAKKASEEGPASISYKGIKITPGGFVEAATTFRSHATGFDINTQLTGIPYPNSALSRISENVFSARQSRLSLLLESTVGTAKVTGYVETDFLGAGVTSNNRQSNSYVLRYRQFWGRVAFENGLSVAAGQMWSLVTESKKGIENRQENLPLIIDPQYIVGWAWQRAYEKLRVRQELRRQICHCRPRSRDRRLLLAAAALTTTSSSTRLVGVAVSTTSWIPPVTRPTRRPTSLSRPRWIQNLATTKWWAFSASSAPASILAALSLSSSPTFPLAALAASLLSREHLMTPGLAAAWALLRGFPSWPRRSMSLLTSRVAMALAVTAQRSWLT